MTFKQRLQSAYKTFTQKSVTGNSLGTVMRNYGKKSDFRPQEQFTGITFKAIDKIAVAISTYEPKVTKANGDPYINHPFYNLFDNPNPMYTASDFNYLYATLTKIYGKTFWYLAKGEMSNKVKEIYLLNPGMVELKFDGGQLVGYVLHKNNGQQVPLTLEEVYFDKTPNPFSEWEGLSILDRASSYVDTEIASSTFTLNYIRNNASPSGIVSLPDMDRNTFNQFAQQWREGYEGPENAGKTAFIRGGEASFKAVGATLKDIDQKVTRDMAKEDVAMMFDIPKELLGMTDKGGLGRANVDTYDYVFSKNTVEPLMKRLDYIYENIANMSNQGVISITHTSPIPEDKAYRLEYFDKGVGRWITPNEIRQEAGLEPIPDGDTLGKTAPAASSVKRITLKKGLTKTEQLQKQIEDEEQYRQSLVKNADLYAGKLKREISKFVNKQEDGVIGRINASSKAYEEWLFSIKDDSEALATLMTPIVLDLMELQIADTANFITGELLTITPEITRTVEAHIQTIAGVYNQDTITALEQTLTEGQSAGESLSKLKKRVEATYQDAKGYRAERIARTESSRSANDAAELTYKQNGYKTKVWFANPGACQFCKALDGKTVSIGKDYYELGQEIDGTDGGKLAVNYSNIATPPAHPNCTCSLNPGER